MATLIRTEQSHLPLLHLVLPSTGGIELTQTVPEMSDLPVIVIPAHGREEAIASALEAGGDN